MSASPKWYDNLNVLLTAAIDFGEIDAGIPSTATEIRLINDLGGTLSSDDLVNARVFIMARALGDSAFKSAGNEFVDRFYVEARIVGGVNKTIQSTAFAPLGAGKFIKLPVLKSDEGIKIEVRANPPFDALGSPEVTFAVEASPSEFLQAGLTEGGADGVYHGLGDAGMSEHVIATTVVENPGGADDQVQLGLQVWLHDGEMFTVVDALSAASTAAATGKERYDLYSLKSDGTLELTAGTEVTAPATDSDKPAIPTGNLPLAYLLVDDTDIIADSDITNIYVRGMFTAVGNGLNLEVGGGTALVDNALIMHQQVSIVPMVANDTNYVWLVRAGGFTVTQVVTPPEDRALLMYQAVTGASSVTTLTDRRHLVGGDIKTFELHWDGTVVVNSERHAVLNSLRDARILPVGGIFAAVGAIGDGTGGQLRFDVEVDDSGYATIFTTGEQPPEILFGATDLVFLSAIPEVWKIPGRARIKAEPSTLPTSAGTDPSDASLTLAVVV